MARPVYTFRKFVGHKKKVEVLRRQLTGSKSRGEPFPPTLFLGPSGVGKTLLAESLAEEYGTDMIFANGYESVDDLIAKFRRVGAYDFVFIDEAHNLVPKAQELLFHVIDSNCVPLWGEKRGGSSSADAGASTIAIHPCTLVLATDQPGKLENALEKRIPLAISLGFYTCREMQAIVDKLATNLSLLMTSQARNLVARVSFGLPRKARHHLENLRRHFIDAECVTIDSKHVRQYLSAHDIGMEGFRRMDRDYLHFLARVGPASLTSIALDLGTDAAYLGCQVEPILKKAGYIMIGPKGRQLTAAGLEWISQHTTNS